MTLRKLAWAADARRCASWEETAGLMSWLAMVWTGEKIDPAKLNPYLPQRPKSEAARKIESEEGFALLKAGLQQLARNKRRK